MMIPVTGDNWELIAHVKNDDLIFSATCKYVRRLIVFYIYRVNSIKNQGVLVPRL